MGNALPSCPPVQDIRDLSQYGSTQPPLELHCGPHVISFMLLSQAVSDLLMLNYLVPPTPHVLSYFSVFAQAAPTQHFIKVSFLHWL